MTLPISKKITAWTYQDLDKSGSNLTTTGLEIGTKLNTTNVSIYAGPCTSFKKDTTGGIVDLKCSTPLYQDGDFKLSAGCRYRNVLTQNAFTGELRGQVNASYTINPTFEISGTVYARGKTNYQTGGLVTSEGGWIAGTANLGNGFSSSVEFQGNFNNSTKKFTPCVNVGLSYKF